MKPSGPERVLLSVGKVAAMLGVSVDTVRAWDRQGKLRAHRLPGGQRRFRRSDVESYIRGGRNSSAVSTGGGDALGPPGPSQGPSPLDESDTFDDDLGPDELAEGTRAEPQGGAQTLSAPVAHGQPPETPPGTTYFDPRRLELDIRLQGLKTFGCACARDVPPVWRGHVVRDLERYVSEDVFPMGLPYADALAIVEARVEALLKPYREEVARAAEAKRRGELLEWLLDYARRHLRMQTTLWPLEEAREAARELELELHRSVEWDCSEGDVRQLVDEFLEEFERDDSPAGLDWDDEADDDDDEDEDPDFGED